MTATATQQIYDLVSGIHQQVAARNCDEPALLADFRDYLSRNPLTSEKKLDLQNRATPSLKSMFNPDQKAQDEMVLFHAFRDPIAKIVSVFNARLDYINDPKKPNPVPFMDKTLARTCFYLEALPRTFREILDIGHHDDNNFARLLNDTEARIVPLIIQLVPFSLDETGQTLQNFNYELAQLGADFPTRINGTEAIAPRSVIISFSPFETRPSP